MALDAACVDVLSLIVLQKCQTSSRRDIARAYCGAGSPGGSTYPSGEVAQGKAGGIGSLGRDPSRCQIQRIMIVVEDHDRRGFDTFARRSSPIFANTSSRTMRPE